MTTHLRTIQNCYEFYDYLSDILNISDYSDGIYNGNRDLPYEVAQQNQAEYLLDEAKVQAGMTLLDIGCGRGRILQAAEARGATAIGITLSPEQVAHCTGKGLDVRLMNYKDMGDEWTGKFDAVIANGSIEHFVSKEQELSGEDNTIYKALFERVHRIINPESSSRRFVTTVIHRRFDFNDGTIDENTPLRLKQRAELWLLGVLYGFKDWKNAKRAPYSLKPMIGSYLLGAIYGGSCPLIGQLEHCAEGSFTAVRTVDGTEDYLWTSEHCTREFRRKFLPGSFKDLGNGARMLKFLLRSHIKAPIFLTNLYMWTAQFRGNPPPVILYRHTWEYLGYPA